FGEAQTHLKEALALWNVFKDARIFALPKVAREKVDVGAQIQRRLNALTAKIDDLWGQGGDDSALRKDMKAIAADFANAVQARQNDHDKILVRLDMIETEVKRALLTVAKPGT